MINLRNTFFLSIIAISAIYFMGAVNIYQVGKLKANGSGTLTFTYSASTSEVEKNNYLIGNFPFKKESIDEYFASNNNKIKSSSVYFKDKDPNLTSVTIVIEFDNIDNISGAKGFSNIKSSFVKNDNIKTLNWIVTNPAANQIDQVIFNLTIECEIVKSANGVIKDKSISFFASNKKSDFKKDVDFTVAVKVDEKTEAKTTKEITEKDGKSCGLFGLELPFIFIGGLILSRNIRRNRTKS